MENWKKAYGWEDYYEVSDLGNVRSIGRKSMCGCNMERYYPSKIIKKIVASNGYEIVNLTGGGKRKQCHVHRLVLFTFVGKPSEKHEACHANGNRCDNRLSNLRWDSRLNNLNDRRIHGTFKMPTAKRVLNNFAVNQIKISKLSNAKLAKQYNVSTMTIARAKKGQYDK